MTNVSNQEKRDALLGELETIREMLDEDEKLSAEELALHEHELDIPVLVPDDVFNAVDNIPVLAEPVDLLDDIPVLVEETQDESAVDNAGTEDASSADSQAEPAPAPRKNPLEVIRAAAAKVAANAVRYRETSPEMLSDMVPHEGIAPEHQDAAPAKKYAGDAVKKAEQNSSLRFAPILPEKRQLVANISALQSAIEAEIRKGDAKEKSSGSAKKSGLPAKKSSADVARDALTENIIRGLVKEAMVEDIIRALMPVLEEQVRKILDEKLQMQTDESPDIF
jgi:hypothetical protein